MMQLMYWRYAWFDDKAWQPNSWFIDERRYARSGDESFGCSI